MSHTAKIEGGSYKSIKTNSDLWMQDLVFYMSLGEKVGDIRKYYLASNNLSLIRTLQQAKTPQHRALRINNERVPDNNERVPASWQWEGRTIAKGWVSYEERWRGNDKGSSGPHSTILVDCGVGWRWEPILSYISKIGVKQNSGVMYLRFTQAFLFS